MKDLIQISGVIQAKIKQLDSALKELSIRAEKKSEAIAAYEKQIALTLIQLKNGIGFTLDGQSVISPSVSTSEKIAKGICWAEKLEMEKTETAYKNLIIGIQCIQAQLNGLQSLLKYTENMVEAK